MLCFDTCDALLSQAASGVAALVPESRRRSPGGAGAGGDGAEEWGAATQKPGAQTVRVSTPLKTWSSNSQGEYIPLKPGAQTVRVSTSLRNLELKQSGWVHPPETWSSNSQGEYIPQKPGAQIVRWNTSSIKPGAQTVRVSTFPKNLELKQSG